MRKTKLMQSLKFALYGIVYEKAPPLMRRTELDTKLRRSLFSTIKALTQDAQRMENTFAGAVRDLHTAGTTFG